MITLPFPPSVNNYWRYGRGHHYISDAGNAYRIAVCLIVRPLYPSPMRGRLIVDVTAYPPDKRKRDLDNLFKVLLDSMQAAGAYLDDSQIDEIHIVRAEVVPEGKLEVEITEIC